MRRHFFTILVLLLAGVSLPLPAQAEVTEADIQRAAQAIVQAQKKADDAAKELEHRRTEENLAREKINATKKKIDNLLEEKKNLQVEVRKRAISAYKNISDIDFFSIFNQNVNNPEEYERSIVYLDSVASSDASNLRRLEQIEDDLQKEENFLTNEHQRLMKIRAEAEQASKNINAALEATKVAKKRLDSKKAQEEAARRAAELARQRRIRQTQQKQPKVSSRGMYCPVGSPVSFIDSWGFPRSGGRRHKGTDMFAKHGTPLIAITNGVIRKVGNGGLGGITLWLKGDNGIHYYYAHNSKNIVRTGQRVTAGQTIAYVGKTGNARTTPPHLHIQVHPGGGSAVNPYPYMSAVC